MRSIWDISVSPEAIGVFCNIAALLFAGKAFYDSLRSSKAASAGIYLTLHASIIRGLEELPKPEHDDQERHRRMGDILNSLECACAIYLDRTLGGNTEMMMRDIIHDAFIIINQCEAFTLEAEKHSKQPRAFTFMRAYLIKFGRKTFPNLYRALNYERHPEIVGE